MNTKVCPRCKVEKSMTEYQPRSIGWQAYCRPCMLVIGKDRYERIRRERIELQLAELARKELDEKLNGRVCMHCLKRKMSDLFYSANVCKECRNNRQREYRNKSPSYNESARASSAAFRQAFPELARERRIAYRKKQTEDLGDWYVKRLIAERSNLKISEIPPALVEIKREHVLVQRLQRQVRDVLGDESIVPRAAPEPRSVPTIEDIEAARVRAKEKYRKRYYADPAKEIDRVRRYKQRKRQERLAQLAKPAGDSAGTTTEGRK